VTNVTEHVISQVVGENKDDGSAGKVPALKLPETVAGEAKCTAVMTIKMRKAKRKMRTKSKGMVRRAAMKGSLETMVAMLWSARAFSVPSIC